MIVKQFLYPNREPIRDICTSLDAMSGLLWISDINQNVLGIMPKWQCVALPCQGTLVLERDGLNQVSTLNQLPFDTCVKALWQQSIQHANLPSSEPKTNQQLLPYAIQALGDTFSGGLMGFIGYDVAAAQHISLPASHVQSPAAIVGDYDVFLRQERDGWQLYGPNQPDYEPIYSHIKSLLNQKNKRQKFSMIIPFQPVWNKMQYAQAFESIQEYLLQGDCYQVNLTQPFKAQVSGSLLEAIEPLMQLTKASYAGYVHYKEFELLSCSPELFVAFKSDGKIVTKPIKGTRPRHSNTQQDEALKHALFHSEKDRAENLMIVDLLRNDLSVYAKTGSVHVPALFEVESFAQVHHLVSEIHATLLADVSPLDVLFHALPGGSITGAPKIRAMQIINELEAESRGAYCGSLGYLNYDNTGQFNILIRSLQKHAEILTAWAGGGITVASECDAEYQECLDKIGAILECVNSLGQSDKSP